MVKYTNMLLWASEPPAEDAIIFVDGFHLDYPSAPERVFFNILKKKVENSSDSLTFSFFTFYPIAICGL